MKIKYSTLVLIIVFCGVSYGVGIAMGFDIGQHAQPPKIEVIGPIASPTPAGVRF
jgi:hypothetical protein